jgi:two-component system chemotaxis sensor kinase CheA
MDDMQEMISEFITDCSENLEEFENNLLDLEKNPESPSVIDSMFRQIHSIKGASGFLAFSNLESLTHKSENVLDLIRQSKGTVNKALISTFLGVCDAMKSMFQVIQMQGTDGTNKYPELIEQLVGFEADFKSGKALKRPELEDVSFEVEGPSNVDAEEFQELDANQIEALKSLGLYEELDTKAIAKEEPSEQSPELDANQIEALKSLGLYDLAKSEVVQEPTKELTVKKEDPKKEISKDQKVSATKIKETIRVEVDSLDHLVNLAGELVLIRNQILELSKTHQSNAFAASFTNLDMITGEIQRSLMTTRMQPISVVWSKMPRIVRDLASQLGREIDIQMHGESTELDKTIIEAITDPMTHIIRNCCDHGIEMPDERIAAGKNPKGTIKLSAEHRGNWIYVDVIDDGKGISREVLKRKAVEKGIHTQEELEQMDDQQILNIIFHPGFSTKDQASNISGRGVGMDVIRSNIMKINGNVELTSVEGEGTHLKMRLPLTLAIIPGVIVLINNQRYAIPQSAVQEVASVNKEDVENFDDIAGQKFTRLRGNILPLAYSTTVLGINAADNHNSDTLNYVVINADGYRYGLVIDKVTDIIEIVVKPLESDQDFRYYAGATIMGDGKVALILDPSKIAEISKIDKINTEEESKSQQAGSNSSDLTLAFKLADDKNYLIPLNKTSRIEEIKKADLDYREIGTFAKFNGKVIRVINLLKLLGCSAVIESNDEESTIKTLYYEFNGHGIAVDVGDNQALLQQEYDVEACENSEFIMGTTLIKDKIYEVLNLEDYLGTMLGSSITTESNIVSSAEDTSKNDYKEVQLFDSANSVISFKLGELFFGIKLDSVSEIINLSEVTATPGSRSSVQGLLNLRGEIMVSRKLANILEIKDIEETEKQIAKSLIVRYNNKKVCLEIGNVNEILSLPENSFNVTPGNIPANIHSYLRGVYNMGGNMLLLLDEKRIVNDLFAEVSV